MTEQQTGTPDSQSGQTDPLGQVQADFEKLSLEDKFLALAQMGLKTAEQSVNAFVQGTAEVGEDLFASIFSSKPAEKSPAPAADSADSSASEESSTTS